MSNWEQYGVCPCGFKTVAHFGDIFFCPDICPKCGREKSEFKLKTMRYFSKAKLHNPLTWLSGEWKEKGNECFKWGN